MFSLLLITSPSFPCHGIFLHPVAQALAFNSVLPCPRRSYIPRNKGGFSFLFFIPAFSYNCLALDKGPLYLREMSLFSCSTSSLSLVTATYLAQILNTLMNHSQFFAMLQALGVVIWWRFHREELVMGEDSLCDWDFFRILICHTNSHEAINSSLIVWLVSLYIFLCQFYPSSHCSARNKSVKSFFSILKVFLGLSSFRFFWHIQLFGWFFKFMIL